jgi:hypothetical protein
MNTTTTVHGGLSTLSKTLVLLAALCAAAPHGSTAQAEMYGVDVANDVWEINPVVKTATKVLTSSEIGQTANALAWNEINQHLFFISGGNTFDYWEQSTNTIKSVGGSPLNLTADPGNAAYYNGSFWYFEHNSNILKEAQISYVGGDPLTATPQVDSVIPHLIPSISSTGYNTNTFGDIAIDHNTGTLYASTSRGRFYAIDLANPGTSFTEITPATSNDRSVGLQLSFDNFSNTLYGTRYTSGEWFTIDTTTGNLNQIAGFNTIVAGGKGFRDLGGAAAVPEPSTIVMLPAAGLAFVGLRQLRRRKAARGTEHVTA